MEAALIFPHQLFVNHPSLKPGRMVLIVENHLFFRQFPFHRKKLIFHRASMKAYAQHLISAGYRVQYIECHEPAAEMKNMAPLLEKLEISSMHLVHVTDDWLERQLQKLSGLTGISLHWDDGPGFLLKQDELSKHPLTNKGNLHAAFYTRMRTSLRILTDSENKPLGGQWSFDADNRKRYPAGMRPPAMPLFGQNKYVEEARIYVKKHFPDNPGDTDDFFYPVTHDEASVWLHDFIKNRLASFGPYEDAIVHKETLLHHSLLSPLINAGILTIQDVLDTTLNMQDSKHIPIASLEGFIRQVIGWREYIRLIYEKKGRLQRTGNHWNFSRKIPASFWQGNTGIAPVDITIKKVLRTGYCHHIERLMVLGNFMLLCEFDPDEVYAWFMALFIDAYDWVMVPNIYGMSQYADGGLMCTKPYISGSNYLVKMSDYPKGDWQAIWDALFWRFMHVYRDRLSPNPRLGMLIRTFDKMPPDKRNNLLNTAENFLSRL